MTTRVADLSIEELRTLVNETVDSRLAERLGDPDVGLEVRPEVIKAIRKSRRARTRIPARDVAKRLGLKW